MMKGETDPSHIAALNRELKRTQAAQALADGLRRMGIWLRGLDTGVYYYGAPGHPVIARGYSAKRITTMDGVTYEYGGSILD